MFPKILLIALVLFVIIGTHLAFAITIADPCPPKEGITYKCNNPLTSSDLPGLIKSVINQLKPLVRILLALIIIGYGFLYVLYSSTDNKGGLGKLKKAAIPLLIGVLIVLSAETIICAAQKFAGGTCS